MFRISLVLSFWLGISSLLAQNKIVTIDKIDLESIPVNTIQKLWLNVMEDGLSQSIQIPVIVAKGTTDSIVLGLTAAIHGNELNGIGVIHSVLERIDIQTLRGTIIAIPGINTLSIPMHQRTFPDGIDLNRIFPGKEHGNRSQQFVWQIKEKILTHCDYLIDMHTASFGRENCFYVRANLNDAVIRPLAMQQWADVILHNEGQPSFGEALSDTRTLRQEAESAGIPSITVEYGNPQVFQQKLIQRGVNGIMQTLYWLDMIREQPQGIHTPVKCDKSYWLYTDHGGYLTVHADLLDYVLKGEIIATLRNPFGDTVKNYTAPENGIVIGKSTNPVNMTGGRIIHLGILSD